MRPRPLPALFLLLASLAGAWFVAPRTILSVEGRVTDDDGPVAGARVRFRAEAFVALTGPDGRFHLTGHAGREVRITAAREGYVIAGADASASANIRLRRLPAADSEDYAWVDPAPDALGRHNCGNCHGAVYREWAASGHARSVRNRRFLNLYDGTDWNGRPGAGWNLLADNPAGSGVCNACHAPTASFDDDLRRLRGVTVQGVHCDFCHKVVDAPGEVVGLTHGRYGLTLQRPTEGQLFFGPLDDVDRGEDAYSPLYRESRYCASCHEGVVFGVHAYSTYSEWLASPARSEGKQCQYCHMRPTGTLTNLAPGHGGLPRDPRTLASHQFSGGEPEMLRRCLKLSARIERVPVGVTAAIEVRATGVGHRVPTGFADRHLVLVVEAFDGTGRTVAPRSGPVLPAAAGALAGLPGKLYAKQLVDFQGRGPAPFWRADPEFLDSRLEPERSEHVALDFPEGTERLRIRLVYRRFWPEVTRAKAWPDDSVEVEDRTLHLPGLQAER